MGDEQDKHYYFQDEGGLTVETAWNIGKALAEWLPTDGAVAVTVHPAAERIGNALIEGVRLQGRRVVHAGIDRDAAAAHIKTAGLAGGAAVGFNEMEKTATVELYQSGAWPITTETGLEEIRELVNAGNFVPAPTKGDLTRLA